MWGTRALVLLIIALGSAGCARTPARPLANAAAPADLDRLIYAERPVIAKPAVVVASAPAPIPVVVPAVVAKPAVVKAAVVAVPVEATGSVAKASYDEPYTLDSGDRLRVVVFGQDGLSNSYTVDAAGNINLPLVGAVKARGSTTAALARVVADRLRNGYVREPHVAIEVELYRPFFILGEVLAPGQYPYVPNMSVETAVAIAGGYTPRAFRRTMKISRPWHGQIYREEVPATYPVRPGDTITIGERWF